MSINCIIVDDEISSQDVIKHFITKTEMLLLQQTCSSASEAFEYLQLHPDIDLIFLDINMPNQSGLDFYKTLIRPPKVIFTTAYPQFAVEGFEVEAIDYLLKPISYQRFLTSIGKAIKLFSDANDQMDYLVLKENKSFHKVFFKNILFVEAFGDYVKVHADAKTVMTNTTFKKLNNSLPDHFLQVHKSYTVNINKLQQVSGNLIFIDKYKIPIGQTYKKAVMANLF